jgi:hypothetical protein
VVVLVVVAVVVAPRAVAVKVAGEAVAVKVAGEAGVAVVKGMAVDGQVERVTHPAEGAALHRLAVAKSKFGAALA